FSRAKTGEIIMAVNRLPTMFTCGHEDLFRFTSYRWMHLMRELPLDHPFDNFRLPQNITSPSKVLFEYSKIVKNAVFIFDENLYLNMIKDIQYFYKRKLISEDDLLSLKESLISIIDWGKGIMLNDQLDSSNSFYLSTLNLNSNTIYFRYDDIEETDIWSFSPNPIYIKDPVSCSVHRKWLHSLRRYSALISGANENIFYDFMNKQYDYVRNIDKIFL
ncbi:MAG: hypothetical protein LIO93_05370, partial [Bacteroidales bacterium]|nr:hypothetical protein [Bacteroidales bacterium]